MILYKYFRANENAFKSLIHRGLYCNHAVNMNDPFDCLALVDRKFSIEDLTRFRTYLAGFPEDQLANRLLALDDVKLATTINEYRRKRIEKFSFCSLCENFDNILMWSHYADSHKGFVLGIDFPEVENNDPHFQKVRYVKQLPDLDLLQWGSAIFEFDKKQHSYILGDISVKSNDWQYENEWRIWRKESTYYRFDAEQISGIYFGISCPEDTQIMVFKMMSGYLNDDKVMIYNMEFDGENIKLKF